MKSYALISAAAAAALMLAACGENPSAPRSAGPSLTGAPDVVIMCDPNIDPGCDPGATSPLQELITALTSEINQLHVSPILKARLVGYVNQLPTTLEGLTPEEKQQAIQRTQAFIALVQSLSPRPIPTDDATEIVRIANLLIAVLSA